MTIRWIGMPLLALAAVDDGYGQTITAASLNELATSVESRVIDWRRDIHANPELGNREFRTAALVARHLESLGIEVTTGVAHTGVVGVLRGGRQGRVVALRADMDALPVTEQVDIPFASRVTTNYEGREVGVMHACGHDTHVAMLMGVAEAMAAVRESLPGTVMFIFQPAEEGAPTGEEGGAELMLEEGIFNTLQPDAIFALHAGSDMPAGTIGFRAGPAMASADTFSIVVNGRQTHGAMPWNGIDPIVAASQIVISTQSIVSRQIDISGLPAVISFGMIEGGVRTNIIPDTVRLAGTIRTYNAETQNEIHKRLTRTAHSVAESVGATAEVDIEIGYPPTTNDPELAQSTRQILESALGRESVVEIPRLTAAEDFSYFANTVPGLMMTLGVRPPDVAPGEAAPNHSSLFYVDEDVLVAGVRALLHASMAALRE